MGKDDDPDFELEMLRQAALNSLKQNRAKKASTRKISASFHGHRPVASNRNLIEIHTTEQIETEDCLMEEIVIAEGLDLDDSDCDEVIEEVIMSTSDEEEEDIPSISHSLSPPPHRNSVSDHDVTDDAPPCTGNGEVSEENSKDEESSSDDDALSVASRYSLYDEELEEPTTTSLTLPVRLRIPVGTTTVTRDDNTSTAANRRRRSRSRNREMYFKRTSPPLRRRRSRSRSPRRRAHRSRSRSRDHDSRRSLSKERNSDFNRAMIERRKPDILNRRQGQRLSPAPSKFRSITTTAITSSVSSRRRSRSKSLERERRNFDKDFSSRINAKKREKSSTPPPKGVDAVTLEKRRRKFQSSSGPPSIEGKKIRLHRINPEKLKDKPIESNKSQRQQHRADENRLHRHIDNDETKVDAEITNMKIKVDQEQPAAEQEDLRARLIKKKQRQQGQNLGGSRRIFSEALKGTRLDNKSNDKKNSEKKSEKSNSTNHNISDKDKRERNVKRKVSLSYV